MGRKGRRLRLAKGIFRDGTGLAVVIRAHGQSKEFRLPASTRLETARAEQVRRQRQLEDTAPARPHSGTLAADVAAYLARLPEGPHQADRRVLLTPWVAALGQYTFVGLTRQQIISTLMAWERAGIKAPTRNKRLSALRVLWRTVTTDPDRPHPCERVDRAAVPKAHANRARRMDLIQTVLSYVTDDAHRGDGLSRVKLQLTLLAWTGQPASLLSQIRPEHVRWHTSPPEMYLQPRRKGAGVDAAWVPLLPQGAAALKAWLTSGAWDGPWHKGNLSRAWHTATAKAQAALEAQAKAARSRADKARLREDAASLTGCRVYDLRHSFLTAMGALPDVDIYAVAEYARHADIRTTQVYMRGASSAKMRSGIASLGAALPVKPAGTLVKFRRA